MSRKTAPTLCLLASVLVASLSTNGQCQQASPEPLPPYPYSASQPSSDNGAENGSAQVGGEEHHHREHHNRAKPRPQYPSVTQAPRSSEGGGEYGVPSGLVGQATDEATPGTY